jgi:hypothetical protein
MRQTLDTSLTALATLAPSLRQRGAGKGPSREREKEEDGRLGRANKWAEELRVAPHVGYISHCIGYARAKPAQECGPLKHGEI